ncbi:hypothetical protein DL765_004501 [Monosporascus sp. GIB2]|nr:hypothetical protein DL765_004501 [Monosporascus sp. GIB2]
MEPSSIAGKKQYAKPPDWIRHKPTIKRLYLDLGWTLERVQSYMEGQHEFYATAPGLSDLQRVVAAVQLYYRASLYAVDSPHGDWQRLVLGTGTADDSRTVHDKFAQLLMVKDTFMFVADAMRTRSCPSIIEILQPLFDKLRYFVMYHNPEIVICILRILEVIRLQQQSRLASILQRYVLEMSCIVLGKRHLFSVIWKQLSQCTNNEMRDIARHIRAAATFELRCARTGDGSSSVTSFDFVSDQYAIRKENVSARARTWLDIYHYSRAAQPRKAAPDTPVSSALPVALEHLHAGRFADAEAFVRIAYHEIDSGNAPDVPPLLLTWTLAGLGFARIDTDDLESAVSLFRLAILNSERAGETVERDMVQSALQLVLDRQKRCQSGSAEYASGSVRRPLEACAWPDVHTFAHLFTDIIGRSLRRGMSASRSKCETYQFY